MTPNTSTINLQKPDNLALTQVSITEPTLSESPEDKSPAPSQESDSKSPKEALTPTLSVSSITPVPDDSSVTVIDSLSPLPPLAQPQSLPSEDLKKKSSLSLPVEDTNGGTHTSLSTPSDKFVVSDKPKIRKLSVHGLIAPFTERRKSSGNFVSDLRRMSLTNNEGIIIRSPGGTAVPGSVSRNRPSSKMTKYVECWGADKPFANITDSTMAKNIGLASIAMIESNLLPPEQFCSDYNCFGPPRELRPVTMWYRNTLRETMYRAQPDPHFRFDLVCAMIVFVSIAIIQLIVVKCSFPVLGSAGASGISLSIFLYLSHYQMSEESPPGNDGPGQVIAGSRSLRLAIFLISTALIAATSVFSVVSYYLFKTTDLNLYSIMYYFHLLFTN